MAKTILILTNIAGRNEILKAKVNTFPDDLDIECLDNNGLNIIILNDLYSLRKVKDKTKGYDIDYLAYHNTVIDQKNGLSKDNLKDDIFKNAMIKGFSHDVNYVFPNDLYNQVLPKVYGHRCEEITLTDIEKYFPSDLERSLNLLHDIHSGVPKTEFYKKEIYGELIKEAKADKIIDSLTDDWCYSENKNEVLNDLRDKLLTYATKH